MPAGPLMFFFLLLILRQHFDIKNVASASVTSSECFPTTYVMCQDQFIPSSDKHFIIKSPALTPAASYGHDLDCYLLINHQVESYVLVLQFGRFDVEFQEHCDYDNLKVAGQTFCGNWLHGKTLKVLVQAFKMVEFHFTSDTSISGSGFLVTVDLIPYFDGETVLEYGGPGSSYQHVYIVSTSQQGNPGYENNFLGFLNHLTPQNRSQKVQMQHSPSDSNVITAEQPNMSRKEHDVRWFDLK
ncbi:hypothetical protein BgiMline_002194 [Biomphalaria glabrata]|nr:voltage-gated sodium channel beta subunit 4; partial [Biomphalaria glabrata]